LSYDKESDDINKSSIDLAEQLENKLFVVDQDKTCKTLKDKSWETESNEIEE
jgi:hypothetical protein